MNTEKNEAIRLFAHFGVSVSLSFSVKQMRRPWCWWKVLAAHCLTKTKRLCQRLITREKTLGGDEELRPCGLARTLTGGSIFTCSTTVVKKASFNHAETCAQVKSYINCQPCLDGQAAFVPLVFTAVPRDDPLVGLLRPEGLVWAHAPRLPRGWYLCPMLHLWCMARVCQVWDSETYNSTSVPF